MGSSKVTWPFYHVFVRSRYNSTTTVPIATKLGSALTWLKGLQAIKSYNILIIKNHYISTYYQSAYGHQTWQDGNLP